jgi:hypothetical protein
MKMMRFKNKLLKKGNKKLNNLSAAQEICQILHLLHTMVNLRFSHMADVTQVQI